MVTIDNRQSKNNNKQPLILVQSDLISRKVDLYQTSAIFTYLRSDPPNPTTSTRYMSNFPGLNMHKIENVNDNNDDKGTNTGVESTIAMIIMRWLIALCTQ